MSARLAIDVGGSGVRMVASMDDVTRTARSDRDSPVRGASVDLHQLQSLVSRAARKLDLDRAGGLEIGLSTAGYHRTGTNPDSFHEAVRLDWRVTRTVVVSDVVASFIGCLGDRPGALVSAGTGAVAIGRDARGMWRIADGWGYMLGDEGSGFWVGRAGLEAALRYKDGRDGGSELLHRCAVEAFGELDELPGRLAGDADRLAKVAGFARLVVSAADAGDSVASGILDDAANALLVSLRAVLPDGGVVSCAGGLLTETNAVVDRLQKAASTTDYVFEEPAGDALSGLLSLLLRPSEQVSTLLGHFGSVRDYT